MMGHYGAEAAPFQSLMLMKEAGELRPTGQPGGCPHMGVPHEGSLFLPALANRLWG
jgi:hypothetical protein